MNLDIKQKMITQQWCPPNLVFQRWNELVNQFTFPIVDNKNEFKKAREMHVVAFALFGFHINDNFNYLMLPASEKDQSPDVYTLYQTEHPVHTHYQTVEVVTFKGDTGNDVDQFILDTKLLNKQKAYDEDTIILCEIRKEGTKVEFNDLYQKFSLVKFKPTNVYIIGELQGSKDWLLSQVWPDIGHQKYDVVDQSNKYPVKRPSIFQNGQSETFDTRHLPDMPPPNMYQMFGLNEAELNKKYGKNS